MIRQVENFMYLVSELFLAPTLILLVLLFVYSLYALGAFAWQTVQRNRQLQTYADMMANRGALPDPAALAGYPLASFFVARSGDAARLTRDHLDIAALKELEGVRTASRVAPMLGLIATMIPMGPALKSLGEGNVQGISENLIVAFSAVIFGLVIASITFWIASVKKRWLANELVDLTELLDADVGQTSGSGGET